MYRMQLGLRENESLEFSINRYDWDHLETVCNNNPKQIQCMLKNTNTPLHEICNTGSAPFHMIKKVLDCWNEATIIKNCHGETPLHIKCKSSQYSCSTVKMLIAANKKALRMLDNTGKSPLSVACLSGACISVIQELVISYPEALKIRDVDGHTPLDLLWSTFAKTIPGASAISRYLKNDPNEGKYTNQISVLLDRFCKKMSFSLSKSYSLSHRHDHEHTTIEGNRTLLCHAIICEDLKNSPHIVLQLFLLSDTSLGYQVDKDGNTPLHLQIESKWNNECIFALIEKSKGYPSSIKNNRGMLPLHIALRRMQGLKSSNIPEDVIITVRKLVTSFPEALSTKDPSTMLYPFMTAAAAGSLQLTYELFLSQPNLVLSK